MIGIIGIPDLGSEVGHRHAKTKAIAFIIQSLIVQADVARNRITRFIRDPIYSGTTGEVGIDITKRHTQGHLVRQLTGVTEVKTEFARTERVEVVTEVIRKLNITQTEITHGSRYCLFALFAKLRVSGGGSHEYIVQAEVFQPGRIREACSGFSTRKRILREVIELAVHIRGSGCTQFTHTARTGIR